MSIYKIIIEETEQLVSQGDRLLGMLKDDDQSLFKIEYQAWYTQSLAVVEQLIPKRSDDFKSLYQIDRRSEPLTVETYTLRDFCLGVDAPFKKLPSRLSSTDRTIAIAMSGKTDDYREDSDEPLFDKRDAVTYKLIAQIGIVNSAIKIAFTVLRDIRGELQAELLDTDLDSAKELLKNRYVRSAGVICGVVLEAHLKSVCAAHGVPLGRSNYTLNFLRDELKKASICETAIWRRIGLVADIRNRCAHDADKEPTFDDVDDMIRNTEKLIKEIW